MTEQQKACLQKLSSVLGPLDDFPFDVEVVKNMRKGEVMGVFFWQYDWNCEVIKIEEVSSLIIDAFEKSGTDEGFNFLIVTDKFWVMKPAIDKSGTRTISV